MADLNIEIRDAAASFSPNEEVTGTASWQVDQQPKSVELRLFWYTKGIGTTDLGVADSVQFEAPLPTDRREFRLRFPNAPFSFSGKLISLLWALELVVDGEKETARVDLTMSPTLEEVVLHDS